MTIRSAPGRPAGLRCGHRGSALAAILISVMMMAAVVITALVGISASSAQSRGRLAREQALINAETGANRALWEIEYGDWNGWSPGNHQSRFLTSDVTTGAGEIVGSFTVTVSDPSKHSITIASVGSRGTGYDTSQITRQVDVTVTKPGGWFQWAMLGSELIKFEGRAELDAYDSSLGSYPASASADAKIAAMPNASQTVKINSDALHHGDAYCHPDADPNAAIIGPITGQRERLDSVFELPQIPIPSGFTVNFVDWTIDDSTYILDEDVKCKRLEMIKHAVIEVEGHRRLYIYQDGGIIKDTSEIRIPDGSSLRIYLASKPIWVEKNARINTGSQDPSRCIIYGLSDMVAEVELKEDSAVYAVFYLPSGTFRTIDRAVLYGSVIGRAVNLKDDSWVHHDKALAAFAAPGMPAYPGAGGKSPTIVSWKIAR